MQKPNPSRARAERTYTALFRLAERHGGDAEARARQVNPAMLGPHEAVRLAAFLAGGSAGYRDGEPEVDADDLTAALTLVPLVRAELDELELSLLLLARGRGMTWADIAFGLGLGSAQAASQRHDRLASRTE
ncbi:DNA-binding protein [Cryptosporangium phraense]|uniref:DNA-binding protein n=1 Tax=Cryptosporangium phraense TaxID=2593070 RepID=A0A545AZN7_9ACTN|nr:DNA-binding protein [Cryptosporangium phraense]TQS46782.1 DNA-binding protein [Cryptosporangium phraense]